jgi:glycosyltransferase involved in cell wall biosynthesis
MHFVHPIRLPRGYLALFRYVAQFAATLILLLRARPAVVFVQSPPNLAVLCAFIYRRLTGSHYVIDAHSAALLSAWWTKPAWFNSLLAKEAIATIVTNEHLQEVVAKWGARSFLLRDVPTDFTTPTPTPLRQGFTITVVNTFARDEPLSEVLEAARQELDVQFLVTGRKPMSPSAIVSSAPSNVRFTDFLPNDEYYRLLASSHAVVCLTTRNFTMQRGACEALSLARPIITSDWPLLRTHFRMGTVHVDNTAASIAEGIRLMRKDYARYESEVRSLRILVQQQVESDLQRLETLVQSTLEQGSRRNAFFSRRGVRSH